MLLSFMRIGEPAPVLFVPATRPAVRNVPARRQTGRSAPLTLQTVLADLLAQRLSVNPQELSRLGAVPAELLESFHDFALLRTRKLSLLRSGRGLFGGEGQIAGADRASFASHH